MQRYYWPNYDLQLLGELQKQQNSAQFCDTLLQTEGISVPTHSCILAALSPYFSQRLSSSPSPPSGQKHLLKVHTVTAHILLKLVGLMYSGELEVKGNEEKSELLAVANRFGFSSLVEGCKDGVRWQGISSYRETYRSLKMQDAQVQVEMALNNCNSPERKSSASVGTQTVVFLDKETAQVPFVSFSAFSQCENTPVDKLTCLTPCPTITSDGESDVGPSTNHKRSSALSCETDTFAVSLIDSSSSRRSQEEGCSQQSPEYENNFQILERREEAANCKVSEYGGISPHQEQAIKGQTFEEKKQEGRHSFCKTGVKNLAKRKQMKGTTEISMKVKLRKTTTGEVWEVVSKQDNDETLSLVSSVRQGCSTQVKDFHNPSSSANPLQKPEAGNPQPLVASSSINSSDSSLLSVGRVNMSHSSGLESELEVDRPQPQETDEQIEMLLENIMKSLNILPNLDGACKKLQAGHDRESALNQTPENDLQHSSIYAASSPADCVFFQDLEADRGCPPAHTDLHCCAQNWPGSTNPPAVQLCAPTQQDSQINLSVRSLGQTDTLRNPGMLVSKHRCPTTSTPEPALPLACTSRQKLHRQPQFSGKDQTVLGLLPLHEADGHSNLFSLPRMDDMRLPPCLSPLELFTPEEKHQYLRSDPTNSEKQAQSQPHQRLWLAETPQSLEFPFSSIIKNSKVSLLCKNINCGSECFQQYSGVNQQILGSRKQCCSVKSLHSEKADSLKRDSKGHEVIHKKRRRRQIELLQDFNTAFLAPKKIKVTDGTNTVTDIEKEKSWGLNVKSAEQTWIRTRGFVNRYLQNTCNTVPEMSQKSAGGHRDVNKLGAALPKRKRGRPHNKTVEQKPSSKNPTIAEDESDKCKSEVVVEEDRPKKKITPRCSKKTNKKTTGSKPPWMASLKEFQKLVQRRHFKTKTVKESQEGTKPSRNSKGGNGGKEGDTGYNSATKSETDSKETSRAKNQEPNRADENNQPCNTTPAHCSKTVQDDDRRTSVQMLHFCGDKQHPVSSQDCLEEELVEVSSNKEQKNTNEGVIYCSGDFKADQSVPSDGMASYCSSLQSNVSVDHNAQPQTPQKTVPLVERSDQREEEEEEEEIDVLLCSPDKGTPQRALLNSMIITVDDEEEDVNEIDVTGDDA